MHQILDDDRAFCPACRTIVPEGEFCGECSERLRPKADRPPMDCPTPNCDTVTTCRFCPDCGARVLGELTEKLWRGEVQVSDLVTQLTLKHWAKFAPESEP